jgi:hypothetical protein
LVDSIKDISQYLKPQLIDYLRAMIGVCLC